MLDRRTIVINKIMQEARELVLDGIIVIDAPVGQYLHDLRQELNLLSVTEMETFGERSHYVKDE